ncbi:hypothetical protein ACFPM3_05515 [Streptomyces coeruleoprunus]|uniref:PEGA domain-containing protein n=1 Tax=Streptomyces coeruleoprunus TaxID=285563 RepID=A0ABV9X938_9ACTN
MAAVSRFHVDQDGHSVTVQVAAVSGPVEVLVDGKVVARGRAPRAGTTVLHAELPGDPARPLGITLRDMGGVFLCEMEVGRTRYLMPRVPLFPERPPAWRTPPHPFRRMHRSLRRAVRRAMGRGLARRAR